MGSLSGWQLANIQGGKNHVKAGRWEVGGTGERGRGMLLGQAGDMDEDREHTAE